MATWAQPGASGLTKPHILTNSQFKTKILWQATHQRKSIFRSLSSTQFSIILKSIYKDFSTISPLCPKSKAWGFAGFCLVVWCNFQLMEAETAKLRNHLYKLVYLGLCDIFCDNMRKQYHPETHLHQSGQPSAVVPFLAALRCPQGKWTSEMSSSLVYHRHPTLWSEPSAFPGLLCLPSPQNLLTSEPKENLEMQRETGCPGVSLEGTMMTRRTAMTGTPETAGYPETSAAYWNSSVQWDQHRAHPSWETQRGLCRSVSAARSL